jgi:hypothetical protein
MRFENFVEIVPKPIVTADRRAFEAVGKGDMYIEVPNRQASTKILLKDVLYAPAMGITLVSISRVVAAKCTVVFSDATCRIFDSKRELVGVIPVGNGLYRVIHKPRLEEVSMAAEMVTINDLHCRMGHIAFDAARDLVRRGLVEGLELDESSQPGSCDSCEYAKATRKPIRRERIVPQAENFGDEIHTDLWGPSPVKSIGGCEYVERITNVPIGTSLEHALGVRLQPSTPLSAYHDRGVSTCTFPFL